MRALDQEVVDAVWTAVEGLLPATEALVLFVLRAWS